MYSFSFASRHLVGACFCLLSWALAGSSVSGDELRTWTDVTGKFEVEASFVEVRDGKARLERKDGTFISVPLSKLCKEDRQYLRDLVKSQRAAKNGASADGFSSDEVESIRLRAEETLEGITETPPNGLAREGGETTKWKHSRSVEVEVHRGRPAPRSQSAELPKRRPNPADYYPGQRVEIRDGTKWRPATVVKSDSDKTSITVRTDATSLTAEVDNAHDIRPLSAKSVDAASRAVGVPAKGFDFSKVKTIVAQPHRNTTLEPDPSQVPLEAIGSRSIAMEEPGELDLLDFDITPRGEYAAMWWGDRFYFASTDHMIDLDEELDPETAAFHREHMSAMFAEEEEDAPPPIPVLQIVDLHSGKVRETARLKDLRPNANGDNLVSLSPSGNRVVLDIFDRDLDHLSIYNLRDGAWEELVTWAPLSHVEEDAHAGGIDWIDENHLLVRNGYINPGDTLVCWQVNPLKPLYQVRVPNAHSYHTQFSPGRNNFFISSDYAIHAFDAKTGKHLADLGRDEQINGTCAVSPDGKSLAAIRNSEIVIIDLASGAVSEVIYSEQPLHQYALSWIGDNFLLAEAVIDHASRQLEHQLYDLTRGIVLWRYSGLHSLGNHEFAVGREFWQFSNNYLIAHSLPDAAAQQARDALLEEDLIAVPTGSTISVDVSNVTQEDFRQECDTYLQSLLEKAGHKIEGEQSIRLVARIEEKERRNMDFFFTDGKLHFNPTDISGRSRPSRDPNEHRSMIYPVREYQLDLMVDDKIVWSRSRTTDIRPLSLTDTQGGEIRIALGPGETADQAAERITRLSTSGFGGQVPRAFPHRIYTEPLGTTSIKRIAQ